MNNQVNKVSSKKKGFSRQEKKFVEWPMVSNTSMNKEKELKLGQRIGH